MVKISNVSSTKRTFKNSLSLLKAKKKLKNKSYRYIKEEEEEREKFCIDFIHQINLCTISKKFSFLINKGELILYNVNNDENDEYNNKEMHHISFPFNTLTSAFISYQTRFDSKFFDCCNNLSYDEKFIMILSIFKKKETIIWNNVLYPFLEMMFTKNDSISCNPFYMAEKTYFELRNIILQEVNFKIEENNNNITFYEKKFI
jgi:hypothetical protein